MLYMVLNFMLRPLLDVIEGGEKSQRNHKFVYNLKKRGQL